MGGLGAYGALQQLSIALKNERSMFVSPIKYYLAALPKQNWLHRI